MRPALDPAGHQVPRTKPTCLLRTWRPQRRRPSALVLHLHQHQSSRNLHLQYLAKNQSTQHYQSLITQGSDHPPVLEPHMVLKVACRVADAADPPCAPPRSEVPTGRRRRATVAVVRCCSCYMHYWHSVAPPPALPPPMIEGQKGLAKVRDIPTTFLAVAVCSGGRQMR
jgi:hypothetical protein